MLIKLVQKIFKGVDTISQIHLVSGGLVPADIEGTLTEHSRWKRGDWTRMAGHYNKNRRKIPWSCYRLSFIIDRVCSKITIKKLNTILKMLYPAYHVFQITLCVLNCALVKCKWTMGYRDAVGLTDQLFVQLA